MSVYDWLGLALGIAFVVPAILLTRARNLDRWMWPGFLTLLPVFYMGFGALAGDLGLVVKEFAYGLPFIVGGLFLLSVGFRYSVYAVALLWIAHAGYDFYHDVWFVNPGVFAWYPVFCAIFDFSVGGYLIATAARFDELNIRLETREMRART